MSHEHASVAAVEVDHVTICWTGDHAFQTFSDTADSERLAARLVWFIALLNERPELIRCVAGTLHP